MRKFLNKLTCMALSLTFLMGCMATPAFAYSGEETGEEVKTPSVFETEEEPVTVTEQDTGPLTPEGNLTVVDDYQTTFSDGTAQQFITLVSKSGAYFYLIIDRAADGDQTAHFLNMVDEADLLTLMDEEDIPEPDGKRGWCGQICVGTAGAGRYCRRRGVPLAEDAAEKARGRGKQARP